MDKKEQTRLRVERYRNKQKGVTSDSVTDQGVTQGGITFSMPPNVGTESGQHPFYGMPSVIFTPSTKPAHAKI